MPLPLRRTRCVEGDHALVAEALKQVLVEVPPQLRHDGITALAEDDLPMPEDTLGLRMRPHAIGLHTINASMSSASAPRTAGGTCRSGPGPGQQPRRPASRAAASAAPRAARQRAQRGPRPC